MFQGVYTALVTPFRDGAVDFEALTALVKSQLEAGIHGLVPVATTGEAATMTRAERRAVLEKVLEITAKKIPVIAGVGTNNTQTTIELALETKELGADAGLVVTPYYNKPTQEGLYQHFLAVAEAVAPWPIVLYNVPSRTNVRLSLNVIERLSKVPNIVALKEASGDLAFDSEVLRACPSLKLLSGDDATACPFYAIGGHGVISVASNLAPREMVAMYQAALDGNYILARHLHLRMLPLLQGLFCETSPGPVKYLLARQMEMSPELRLPLVEPTEASKLHLDEIFEEIL